MDDKEVNELARHIARHLREKCKLRHLGIDEDFIMIETKRAIEDWQLRSGKT